MLKDPLIKYMRNPWERRDVASSQGLRTDADMTDEELQGLANHYGMEVRVPDGRVFVPQERKPKKEKTDG